MCERLRKNSTTTNRTNVPNIATVKALRATGATFELLRCAFTVRRLGIARAIKPTAGIAARLSAMSANRLAAMAGCKTHLTFYRQGRAASKMPASAGPVPRPI